MGINSTPNGGTLKEYRTLLLKLLEKVEDDICDVKTDVSDVKEEVKGVRIIDIPALQVDVAKIQTEQKITASIYGILGGFLFSLGLFILGYILDNLLL